jgi:hypothetical protein
MSKAEAAVQIDGSASVARSESRVEPDAQQNRPGNDTMANWVQENVVNPAFNSAIAQPYNLAVDSIRIVTLNNVNLPKFEIVDDKPRIGTDFLRKLPDGSKSETAYKSTLKEEAYEHANSEIARYDFKSEDRHDGKLNFFLTNKDLSPVHSYRVELSSGQPKIFQTDTTPQTLVENPEIAKRTLLLASELREKQMVMRILNVIPVNDKEAKDVDSLYMALKDGDNEKVENLVNSYNCPADLQRVIAHVTGITRLNGERVRAAYKMSLDASEGNFSYLDDENQERHLTIKRCP